MDMSAHARMSTIALLVLVAFMATVLLPMGASASKRGRQNTAVGLTAGAILAGVTGHKGAALVLGAGAAYAWKRHADARTSQAYSRGYHHGYRVGYRSTHHRVHHVAKRHIAKRYAHR